MCYVLCRGVLVGVVCVVGVVLRSRCVAWCVVVLCCLWCVGVCGGWCLWCVVCGRCGMVLLCVVFVVRVVCCLWCVVFVLLLLGRVGLCCCVAVCGFRFAVCGLQCAVRGVRSAVLRFCGVLGPSILCSVMLRSGLVGLLGMF